MISRFDDLDIEVRIVDKKNGIKRIVAYKVPMDNIENEIGNKAVKSSDYYRQYMNDLMSKIKTLVDYEIKRIVNF